MLRRSVKYFSLTLPSQYEIFSYIVDGELEHRDSLGNLEIMKRGEIQMSAWLVLLIPRVAYSTYALTSRCSIYRHGHSSL